MAKQIKIIILFLFLIGCQNKNNNIEAQSLDIINSKYIDENSTCKSDIDNSGLTSKLIDGFIDKIKEEYSGQSFNKMFLIFYTEEGEVIELHNFGLIISNSKTIGYSLLDSEHIKSKRIKKFNVDEFYKYIFDIEEKESINHNRLLIIDIDSKEIVCSSNRNINREKVEKIKYLSF